MRELSDALISCLRSRHDGAKTRPLSTIWDRSRTSRSRFDDNSRRAVGRRPLATPKLWLTVCGAIAFLSSCR